MGFNVGRQASALREQVAIRLTKQDLERLETLVKKIRILSRNAVAREALRIGLAELEKQPTRILSLGGRTRPGRTR